MKHLEVSISEELVATLAGVVRDGYRGVAGGVELTDNYGVSYLLVTRLEGGDVELRKGTTVELLGQSVSLNEGAAIVVRELDVVFDLFWLYLVVDLEPICVGGHCVLRLPGSRKCLRAPKWCVFEPTPDFVVRVDLRNKIDLEISAASTVRAHYQKAGQELEDVVGETAAEQLETAVERLETAHAQATEVAQEYEVTIPPLSDPLPKSKDYDRWIFFLDPEWIDVDVPDFADTTANLLGPQIEKAVDDALEPLPDWAAEMVREQMGSPTEYVENALDLPDDFGEWLSETLGTTFGAFNVVLHLVGDHFGQLYPVYELSDPYDLMAERPGEPPVFVRLVEPEIVIEDEELVIGTDLEVAE